MEIVLNSNTLIGIAGVLTALGVIIGVVRKFNQQIEKWNDYDKSIADVKDEIASLKEEQCMQTYVLEAVLDGLHQLGTNGKTTEASEKLSKFINKKAHDQKTTSSL